MVYLLTKQDCIDELRRVAASSELDNITRNYFREHSNVPDRTWESYFGNFNEFKKQADLIPSRHAQKIISQIARHASVDKFREFNAEKVGYDEKYLRDSDKVFQTVLICSDVHDILCDPFYVRMFLETTRRVQPERIILNGDIFDLTEFSMYTVDPREFDVLKRINWVHKFIEQIRESAPDAQIDFNSGNHEHRLLKHLADASPGLLTLLSDLHGFTVSSLLGLDKYQINFVSKDDLSAFSPRDIKNEYMKNYLIVNEQLLFHHFPEGRKLGMAGANGHHHKFIVDSMYNPTFGPYQWIQTGCGHARKANYCDASKWNNGFLLFHMNTKTKRSQPEYIDTTQDFCMIGGMLYHRTEEELIYYV